jgi:hypothetical protein
MVGLADVRWGYYMRKDGKPGPRMPRILRSGAETPKDTGAGDVRMYRMF